LQRADGVPHQPVEPVHYVPIVPFVLLNGTEGIGTGWSTFVPPFHPADVVANVRRCLAGEPLAPMQPWFRGFKVWPSPTALTDHAMYQPHCSTGLALSARHRGRCAPCRAARR